MLPKTTSLVYLDVGSTDLTDKASTKLFKALETNETIVSLSLQNTNEFRNKFTLKAWKAMKNALSKNKVLTILNLSNTALRNEGLALIAKGILDNPDSSIQSLNLSKNDLTEKST